MHPSPGICGKRSPHRECDWMFSKECTRSAQGGSGYCRGTSAPCWLQLKFQSHISSENPKLVHLPSSLYFSLYHNLSVNLSVSLPEDGFHSWLWWLSVHVSFWLSECLSLGWSSSDMKWTESDQTKKQLFLKSHNPKPPTFFYPKRSVAKRQCCFHSWWCPGRAWHCG